MAFRNLLCADRGSVRTLTVQRPDKPSALDQRLSYETQVFALCSPAPTCARARAPSSNDASRCPAVAESRAATGQCPPRYFSSPAVTRSGSRFSGGGSGQVANAVNAHGGL